jgi:hypothetical protein
MKYQYATDSSGKLVNISTVVKDGYHDEKYYCLDCKQELIPKLGDIRIHHFAHKNDSLHCSKETYLHELGKKIFYDTYLQCLNSNEPFYINAIVSPTCIYNGLIQKNCHTSGVVKINLISIFDKIECEKDRGQFRPDITLFNDKNDCVFIEIAVTHPCDDAKIKSGNRIIEIKMNEETDVDVIENKMLSYENSQIIFYNFNNVGVVVQPMCRNDNSMVDYTVILRDGRAVRLIKQRNQLCEIISANKNIIAKVVPTASIIRPAIPVVIPQSTTHRGPKIWDIEEAEAHRKYYKSYMKKGWKKRK